MSENGKTGLRPVPVDWDEIEKKIREHRRQRTRRILLIAGVIAALCVLLLLYRRFRTFTDYNVIETIDRTDSEATHFVSFGKYVIKYSNDGASMTDADNHTIWAQSFEMQEPIASVKSQYAAFAERGGKNIYIMDEKGYQAKITTDMSINKIDVSNQGNVAVLMQESNVSYLGLYSIRGTKLAEGAIHFESGGYPLDLALSPDGEQLAVSIFNISKGTGGTIVNFYNFGSGGSKSTDNLVAGYTYSGTVIPELYYTEDDTLAAFGDNQVILFNGKGSPSVRKKIKIRKKIKSVFCSDSCFGLLYTQNSDSEGSSAEIYNYKGVRKKEFSLDRNYTKAGFMGSGEIYLTDDTRCAIYERNGHQKFRGKTDTELYMIMSSGRFRKYIFIRDGKTEIVRLKTF